MINLTDKIRRRYFLSGVAVVVFLSGTIIAEATAENANLVFCCRANNDLYKVLAAGGNDYARYDTADEAITKACEGAGVLILADGYPEQLTVVDDALFDKAAQKKLRVYIEFPAKVKGLKTEAPKHFRTGPYGVRYDRTVISSGFFLPALPERSILVIQDCYYIPIDVNNPHMVLAKVVGYNKAVLGLPKEVFPILFEHPENCDVMISTTKLSHFVTGRYLPTDAWGPIWQRILEWLARDKTMPTLKWEPTVVVSYGSKEKLPQDAQLQAVRRSANWLVNSRLLVHESWKPQINPAGIKEAIPRDWKVGDGSRGISEAFDDHILFNGSHTVCRDVRADCTTESAMILAVSSQLFKNDYHRQVSQNLTDYILFRSTLCQGPRIDPASPTYGLIGWAESIEPGKQNMYWGDDNARSLFATMASAASLKTDRWDEAIVRGILANFRTTGPLGFRGGMLTEEQIQANGWQHYWKTERVNYSPHYEARLWASYLWLYDKTGFKPLLDRAKAGIYRIMEAYPDKWMAECGRMEEERVAMILPLAWLVRVEDTPLHRKWLDMMIQYIAKAQHASGAVPQHVDKPYISNDQYGSGEAPIVYKTGDPATDLLYTMNFILSGLHEAASATGNPEYAALEDRTADFLIRIQTRCKANPELDGMWYRSFDFEKWDYWGSDGDLGWGALMAETGWTQSWIAFSLAMREMKTSLWDLTKSSKAGRHFEKYRELMLPANIIQQGPSKADVPANAGVEVGARPVIKRLGAVETDSLICPFVFNGRLYRLEHRLPQYYGVRISDCASDAEFFGHARACIVDHETGEMVAEPNTRGFVMPNVFVDGQTVYVLATDFMTPSPPYGRTVRVWATKDLKKWEQWTALKLLKEWMVGSVSVCKKGDEFYMAMEVTGPVEEVGVGFTARFAKSKDMKNWELLGDEYVYGKERSVCPHFLRYLDGFFYLFYLESGKWEGGSGYVTNVARSRDLVNWQESVFNPVLCPSEEDKQIANKRLTADKQAYVKNGGRLGQAHINNSDMEFTEHNGRVIIGYMCGAQTLEYGFIAEAVYEGTEAQFLRAWFPSSIEARK
ncbi:MAG: hypothetical protein A2Y12_15140 [Planctomycetes bacterium GWF2_42_9]|nr:MAG: hypothetical protein A2Y12_15140 [Planctomycetes bacterium GWF2_42_9]